MRVVNACVFSAQANGQADQYQRRGNGLRILSTPASGQTDQLWSRSDMGREPSEASGKLAGGSIHADGQLVWARDFERCAGVQFVDISGGTRQQIRQWLSIEPSSKPSIRRGRDRPTRCHRGRGDRATRTAIDPDDTTSQGTDVGQIGNAELAQSISPEEPEVTRNPRSKASRREVSAPSSRSREHGAVARRAGDDRWITAIILAQRVPLAALFGSIRERSIVNSAPSRAGSARSPRTH